MKDLFIKWFMAINKVLLRLSHGRIGSRLGRQTILLLHTIGRKSGQDHVIPIAYFDYQNHFLIVASNWGKERQADWYLNLRQNPQARIEVKGKVIPVTAREVTGEEYVRLWKFVTELHPPYLEYQKLTIRPIPIMIFE